MRTFAAPLVFRHIGVVMVEIQVTSNAFLKLKLVCDVFETDELATDNAVKFMINRRFRYVTRAIFERNRSLIEHCKLIR